MSDTAIPTIDDLLGHADFVRAVARACVRGDDLVEDTVQQAWLEVLERGPRHGKAPKAWLARVTRHAGFGLLRKKARRQKHETASVGTGRGDAPNPAEIAEREAVRRRLLEAVLQLEEPYQSAVLLRYYEDLPPRTVAARLGVPVETARTRIKRGLAKLRVILDARTGGERSTWVAAMAPLAGLGGEAAAAAGGLGALGLGLAAAGVAMLLGAGGLWWSKQPDEAPPPRVMADGSDEGPVLEGLGSAPVRGKGRGVLLGRIENAPTAGSLWAEARTNGPFYGMGMMPIDRAQGLKYMLRAPSGSAPLVARAPVDEGGTFRLEGLRAGMYVVRLLADGVVRGVWHVPLLVDGAHMPATLVVPDGSLTLEGRAHYADGTPFRGLIFAQPPVRGGMAAFSITSPNGYVPVHTDAEGAFRLTGLESGKIRLGALSDGRVFVQQSLTLPSASPHAFVVLDRSGFETFRIIDEEGSAVGAAEAIATHGRNGLFSHLLAVGADENGICAVPAEGDLFVSASGFLEAEVRRRKGRPLGDVVLRRGVRFEGRLLRPDGKGAAGVPVFATGARSDGPRGKATSGKDGTYAFPALKPGEYSVYAHGAGWTTVGLAAPTENDFNPLAVEAPPPAAHDIRVVPAGRIEGEVLTEDGARVEGAMVILSYGSPGSSERGLPRRLSRQMMTWLATDAEGRFVADSVVPGAGVRCAVSAPDGTHARSEAVTVGSGETHQVTIRLPRPFAIMAIVADSGTREPVANARLSIEERPNRWMGFGATDRRGRLELKPSGLAAGAKVRVKLECETHRNAEIDVTLPKAGETLRLTLDAGLIMSGRILGADPKTVERIRIEVRDEHEHNVRFGSRSPRPDAEGRFVLRGLAPGMYELRVSSGGRSARVEVAAGTEGVELTLEEPAARTPAATKRMLIVNVRTPDGLAPARFACKLYAKYYAHMKRSSAGSGRGAKGLAKLTAVGPGARFWISIHSIRDAAGAPLGGSVLEGPFIAAKSTQEVDIAVPVAAEIEGRLLSPDGAGLRGAMVEAVAVRDGFEVHTREVHAKVRTGADGAFHLTGLGDLDYALEAKLPDGIVMAEAVRAHGGDKGVRLTSRRGRKVPPGTLVTIVGPDGKPVPQAHMQFTDHRQGHFSASSNAHGEIRFRPGEAKPPFGVQINPPTNRPDLGAQVLPAWNGGPVTVHLPAAFQIRGTVRGKGPGRDAGDARGYIQVMYRPTAGLEEAHGHGGEQRSSVAGFSHAQVDADGRFVIAHLSPGEYELGAWLPMCGLCRMNAVPTLRAQAGDTDVVLPLYAGGTIRVRIENWLPPKKNDGRMRAVLTRFEEGRWVGSQHASVDASGHITFHDIRPGERYRIVVTRSDIGMYALNAHVRLSDEEFRLQLVKGGVVRGRLVLPTSVRPTQVSVYLYADGSGAGPTGTVDENLEFEIRGVRPGSFKLHAQAHTPDAYYSAHVDVVAGDTVTVKLKEGSMFGR